jgi:hypothetical protein
VSGIHVKELQERVMMRRIVSAAFGTFVLAGTVLAQQPPSTSASTPSVTQPAAAVSVLSDAEKEQFLLKAKVGRTRSASKGVTGSLRATLTDGTLTHDAHIQTVDERMQQFAGSNGGVEFDFRDSWEFNLAAYKIDRLIGLNLVPVSVARRHAYKEAAFTWWLDDVMMDEQERLKRKEDAKRKPDAQAPSEPPDTEIWNQQMQVVRMFDQLIANIDRNLGNLMITKDWRLWPIDHTRAFRTNHELKTPANVTRIDRGVLEKMKTLNREILRKETGKHLTTFQIDAILARRDAIVKRIEGLGPAAVFDRQGW